MSIRAAMKYIPAVYSDGSFVSKLFLGLVYLTNKVDESLSTSW